MPERALKVVAARDGHDHALNEFPLAPDDEVKLAKDGDHYVLTISDPNYGHDFVEREIRPGVFEAVSAADADVPFSPPPSGSTTAKKTTTSTTGTRKSRSKKSSAKKSTAKNNDTAQLKGAADPQAKERGQGTVRVGPGTAK